MVDCSTRDKSVDRHSNTVVRITYVSDPGFCHAMFFPTKLGQGCATFAKQETYNFYFVLFHNTPGRRIRQFCLLRGAHCDPGLEIVRNWCNRNKSIHDFQKFNCTIIFHVWENQPGFEFFQFT